MEDFIFALSEIFGGLVPKNNRLSKRIKRIRSRFLQKAVWGLLFLCLFLFFGGVAFLLSAAFS